MDKNIREAGKKYDSTFYDPNDGGAYHIRKAMEKEEREAARAAEAGTMVPKAQPSMTVLDSLAAPPCFFTAAMPPSFPGNKKAPV